MKRFLTILFALAVLSSNAQNLIKNSYFDNAWLFWDHNGSEPIAGAIYVPGGSPTPYITESTFGGPSTTNFVGRVDNGRFFVQQLCILKGSTYQIAFVGSRWTGEPDVPATVGMEVYVLGLPSFTTYSTQVYNFSNTVFGFTTQTQNFSIPAGSTDTEFRLIMGGTPGTSDYGPVIDSVTLTPLPNFDVTGPTSTAPNTATNWLVSGVPLTGVNYTWSFPDATPSSSTSASPTGITWSSVGIKPISCVINNGTCDVATIVGSIDIMAPLPIKLTSFNALYKNNAVDLQWLTDNEINNSYFEVYRSVDGVNWNYIVKINASGTSSHTYYLRDVQPFGGVNYYRLKQVDTNAAFQYSNIIKVNTNGGKNLDLSIYPSVVNNVLNYVVESPKAEKLNVMLSDISGRRVSNSVKSFNGGNTQNTIDVSTLAPGIYLLTIADETNTFKKSVTFKKN